MKKITLLFSLLISLSSFAQLSKNNMVKPGVITGTVIDKTTKELLPYVTIVIKDSNQKIITGGITKEDGTFKIKDIPFGISTAYVQFIGYKTFSKQINIHSGNKNIDLGTIALAEDSAMLDEVEVRAETSTVVQKVDRKVINVGKDLTAAGTSAAELLNNVQSVSVDSQTGAVSLRGNENVRILIDGKPTSLSAAQVLKQIPSSSIKSIELITNPSAKYNPEGMSGIINLILNKNANMGFNGSVDAGITAGHYVRYNASTNMNYKTGKVNFFGNYGYNGGKNLNVGVVDRPGNSSLQDFRIINKNTSHLAKFGADIYLDKNNTLSFYTTQNWNTGGGTGRVVVYNNNTVVADSPFFQNENGTSGSYDVNYKVNFAKKGHSLEFEALYSNSDSPQHSANNDLVDPNNGASNYTNDIENNRKNTLINLDYTNPISDKAKLEMGLEYRTNKTDNKNITNQVGNNSSSFDYERKIYSGYANYSYQLDKFTMQLGARLENYQIEGNFNVVGSNSAQIKDKIFTVYPSAFFTFTPSDKNQFQLSYSRRVDRPSIQQLNPIREWSTPLVTSIGNQDLNPQFTNSFEVNYTRQIKNGSLTFGTFYRMIHDNISRVIYKDPADPTDVKQILSYTNFDNTTAYGMEFSTNYKVSNWWRINSSIDFYSHKEKGTVDLTTPNATQTEVTNNSFNARISNSFKATKNLRLQLFAMYRGAQNSIQWHIKPMWMVNTGASLSVFDGKGSLNFRYNDIFKSMKFAFNTEKPFVQNGKFSGESSAAYIGFNYRFGSGKNKAKARRQRDNNIKQSEGGF